MMFLVVEAYRANRYTIQPKHSSIVMCGFKKNPILDHVASRDN